MLKPQDVLITLRLLLAQRRREVVSYPLLSQWTGLSASESHSAIKRATVSGLVTPIIDQKNSGFGWAVHRPALEEFLVYALRYLMPLEFGTSQRGILAGTAALTPTSQGTDLVESESWVWPYGEGTYRGVSVKPLYPTVPVAAVSDPEFHRVLAATDLVRSPQARLKRLGSEWLQGNLLRQS